MRKIFLVLIIGMLLFSFGCIEEKEGEGLEKNETKTIEKVEASAEYNSYMSKRAETMSGDILITQKSSIKIEYEVDPTDPNANEINEFMKMAENSMADSTMTFAKKGIDKYKVETSGGAMGFSPILIIVNGNSAYQCYGDICTAYEDAVDLEQVNEEMSNAIDSISKGMFGATGYEFLEQENAYTIYKLGEKTYKGIKCTEFEIVFDQEYLKTIIASGTLSDEELQNAGVLSMMSGPMTECIDKKTGMTINLKMTVDMTSQYANYGYNLKKMEMILVQSVTELSTEVSDLEFEVPAGYTITEADTETEIPALPN